MKNLVLVFVVAFVFSTTAMASDIAISTQANWWSQGAADREMQEIADNVKAVSVEQFAANEQDALADWVVDHTGNGESDLLILCGGFPDTIYEPGNGQADNSLAELFLDNGNTIVNTGDYMFYVVNNAGTNAAGGLQTMMDIAGITMWDDDTDVVVTAEGQDYTPSLVDFQTDRPFHLNELEGDWYAELVLAQNDAGTRADPVIVANSATGGRLGIFYQTASQDDDPRGEVISEWINNWYLQNVAGGGNLLARHPDPKDGALYDENTWVNLSWKPGGLALSHDVYFGENFDDVEAGTEDTFQGNQAATYFAVGSFRSPYLVPGATYYWRVDEVNDTEPNSPWKGDVWSFSIPPKTAYFPDPADGAGSVDPNVELSWTGGFRSKLHTVYFGDNFDDVNNAAGGLPQETATYTPGTIKLAKTYYWRVDESDVIETHKGDVWSFNTQGGVGSPKPSNGAVDVKQTQILTFSPNVHAASHQLYFGTDKEVVRKADTGSPEYKGSRNLGSETYDPGKLEWDSTYYWRIDEVNNANPDSPWIGILWSFTTANFLIVDDFEDYDIGNNEIWWSWIDGLGYSSHPTLPAHPGNGTGSAVGWDDTPSYTEETIVHGGNQSMPFSYDNSILRYSEAQKTLTYPRDWTENGVTTLTIWFRGGSANAAEPLYVALNGSAVVTHDNPNAAQTGRWTEWTIDLQAFADQGVNLANVNTIAIGFGNRNNPQPGGSGTVYFDDIRLYRPAP